MDGQTDGQTDKQTTDASKKSFRLAQKQFTCKRNGLSVLFRSAKKTRQVWRKRLFFLRLVHTGVAPYVACASCRFELVFAAALSRPRRLSSPTLVLPAVAEEGGARVYLHYGGVCIYTAVE